MMTPLPRPWTKELVEKLWPAGHENRALYVRQVRSRTQPPPDLAEGATDPEEEPKR